MYRLTAMLIGAAILLAACSQAAPEPQPGQTQGISFFTQSLPETLPPETTPPPPPTPEPPKYSEQEISLPECVSEDFELLIELEHTAAGGQAADLREGYSGAGYISGAYGDSGVSFVLDVPSPQHYSLTLRAASDEPASGKLYIGGLEYGCFALSGQGFESLRFENVFLPAGTCELGFSDMTAPVDLDCVLIEDGEPHADFALPEDAALCTKEPSLEARELYEYILSNYGKKILSGQQASQGTNAELDEIYYLTGKYPAIRFGELMGYSAGADSGDVELAIEWAKSGGIVGYVWNWTQNGSVYAEKTAFDAEKAVTSLDIATMEGEALALRYGDGAIGAETLALIDGIDRAADALKRLRDEGIPVLFRPLPEASGGQFWWSKSAESYLWIYKLIFERMTLYHGLDNLIWIWNGQSPEWYVGDEMCDIISLDVYLNEGESLGSGISLMAAAREISESKPIALSEASTLPQPLLAARDGAAWSFCSAWTGEYSASGSYTPATLWVSFYNNSFVVTKDKIEYNR